MKTSQWGKTLLYTYKYLPRITESIDKMVNQAALNSFYYYSNNQKDNSVYVVSDKIAELIKRKSRLVNIKVLVDKSLLACEKLSGQILVEKYIDNESSEEIAQKHNLNVRTYFRKLEAAETNFYSNMVKNGFDEKKLNDYLIEEKWIIEVFQNFSKQENVLEDFSDTPKDKGLADKAEKYA